MSEPERPNLDRLRRQVMSLEEADEAARYIEHLTPPSPPIHALPPDAGGLTPCCGKTPFELPQTDRMTWDSLIVTCSSDPDPRTVEAMEAVSFDVEAGATIVPLDEAIDVATTLIQQARDEERERWKRLDLHAEDVDATWSAACDFSLAGMSDTANRLYALSDRIAAALAPDSETGEDA